MFPFKTNIISFKTKIQEKEIQEKLEGLILKEVYFDIKSNNDLYGKIKKKYAVYTIGQFPFRNAFVPVVILEWKKSKEYVDMICYYRLDFRITFSIFVILASGMIISFQNWNLIPLFFVLIFTAFLLIVFNFIFRRSTKNVDRTNEKVLNNFITNDIIR
jgi:hypothetical protein